MHNGWIITMPCPECKSKSKNHKDHSVAILMEEGKQLTFRTKKSALEYIVKILLIILSLFSKG